MPTFCRHGSLIASCPICRSTVTAPASGAAARTPRAKSPPRPRRSSEGATRSSKARGTVRVSRESRAVDDGYRCILVGGLRAELEARSLAAEVGFACGRLALLAHDPPGLFAQAAGDPDPDEAAWLVFQVLHISPLEATDPFAAIRGVATTWRSGAVPDLSDVALGPRSSVDAARSPRTLDAYRRWAGGAGTAQAAFTGDPGWEPKRRFERVYERLSLPGFGRQGRYDLLVALGHLGCYALRGPGLLLTEDDATSRAAKRVFAIGDRVTLERRAAALATAAGIPIEALDLALPNWASGSRISLGVPAQTLDAGAEAAMLAALEL